MSGGLEPGPLFGGEYVLRADDFETMCHVDTLEDPWAASMMTDDWRAVYAAMEAQEPEMVSAVVTHEESSAGAAVHAEVEWRSDHATVWIVPDDERLVGLLCTSSVPPADRWRSLAETLEILPASWPSRPPLVLAAAW